MTDSEIEGQINEIVIAEEKRSSLAGIYPSPTELARKILVVVRQAEATRTKQLQELFNFVLAQDKDWRHSYELLGHSYEIYLAECIGFMDELKKKFKGLLKP